MKLHDPDYLQFYLVKRDMSQAQLARRVGIGRNQIWKLLNQPHSITTARATAIEAALEVAPGTLFTDGDPAPPRRKANISSAA